MKKILALLLSLLLMITMAVGCTSDKDAVDEPDVVEDNGTSDDGTEDEDQVDNEDEVEESSIILSTTTSTENSGLLAYLLPVFTEETGIDVKVVAVGTGKALQMGMDGEADILLVHAKASEEEFVEEGHGTERQDVMYNDFVLVGPSEDPAGLKENHPDNILEGLKKLSEEQATFVSRGDDSGTHKKELGIWKSAEIEPAGEWYLEAGAGMGDVLKITDEKQAYTLTDRATYLSMKENLDLDIIIEGDPNLFNQYGIIPVDPSKNENTNNDGAMEFMNWLLGEEAQNLIKDFGVEEYGEPLFVPNAK